MNDTEIIERVKTLLGDKVFEVSNPALRRIFMKVDSKDLPKVVQVLKDDLGFAYLATVSGLDTGENFEIIYHFANAFSQLNLRTQVPKANPHVESICAVIPGAILYERELQDMFGLVVDHLPDPRPLLLPDDWPAGNYPLCKAWKYERPPEKIPGGKS
jgi:NADH-quinone oxidoreductase subunit C